MAKWFIPHDYQKYCIDAIIDKPALALFLQPGLGKTAITLSAIKELKYERFAVCRVLVIAPKKIAEGTWCNEGAKWEQLSPLRMSLVLGSTAERVKALEQSADIYVINRDNVQWLVDYYKHAWPFDMVVLDESTSFKNHRSKRFKALKLIRNKISRIVELTGTPRPRSLMDLWAQIFLLDGGVRLGRTITAFRDTYFTPGKRNRNVVFDYEPREGAEDAIYAAISDICISMKAEDYLNLPSLMVNEIPVVLDKAAQKRYTELEREALIEIDEETVITANTAAALSGKLLQLCNGAVYDEDRNVVGIHDCKIEVLLELIEQLNGEHAIICYNYKHDLERLLAVMPKTKLRYAVYQSEADMRAWNSGEIDLLLIQPVSVGYGLNLQEGGHHMIWFGLTFDAEVYEQTVARLYRQGQLYPVFIHLLVVKGGRDEDVILSLNDKSKAQDYAMNTLKARIQKVKEAAA